MHTSVAPASQACDGPVADLLQGQRVGVGVGPALRERAEPAAGIADVGEVDVPGDHVGDVVAGRVGAQGVGQRGQRLELSAVGIEQRERLGVGQPGRVALRRPERAEHVGAQPARRGGGRGLAAGSIRAPISAQSP